MAPSGKYDIRKLLFRRQFILGPFFIESLSDWKRLKIGETIFLTVHPDLGTEAWKLAGHVAAGVGYCSGSPDAFQLPNTFGPPFIG
jgi:hypothetical protein